LSCKKTCGRSGCSVLRFAVRVRPCFPNQYCRLITRIGTVADYRYTPSTFRYERGRIMAIAEVSIVPVGTGSSSVSRYVAGALEALKGSGLSYRLTPMGTIIEGDLRAVMDAVIRMHESPFGSGIARVYTTVKIDDRRDRDIMMDEKVESVEQKLKG